jgi:Tfp pilus assembly protein PilF
MPPHKFRADVLEIGDELEKAEFALQARRYDLAIHLMRKELSAHPENAVAFYTIARAYVLKRNTPAAINALRESLRLDPENSNSHMLYGTLLKDTGNFVQAEQEFLTSLSINPASHYTHFVYASFLLHQKKNIAKAREHISIALALDASNAKYHLVVGRVLAEEGHLDEADKEYLRALSLDPDDYLVLNSYGAHLLTKKNRPVEAFEFFRQAMLRNPNDPDVRNNLLLALKVKHKFYSPFWQSSLLLRKELGRPRFAIITTVVVGIIVAVVQIANVTNNPALLLLTFCLSLVVIYLLLVNPIFNFLVKRGWIK